MKNYIKILTLLSLLNVGISTLSMQKEDLEESLTEQSILGADLIGGLPNEIWGIVLPFTYFDSNILDGAKDIYDGLSTIKRILSLYSKNIRLTCRTFNVLNNDLSSLKEELRKSFQSLLTENFLDLRETGLYPKDGQWGISASVDQKIALFILTENKIDDRILFHIVDLNVAKGELKSLRNKTIVLLLFYGANVNLQEKDGFTALSWAVYDHGNDNNKKDIIAMLLAHGANVNLQRNDGGTALSLAIRGNDKHNKDIVAMLLAHGANVNLQRNDGGTALILAVYGHNSCINNKEDIIAMLLAHGADVNLQDNNGDTAISLAHRRNFHDFDELVKNYSSKKL
jgi:ankyrin repeat protein